MSKGTDVFLSCRRLFRILVTFTCVLSLCCAQGAFKAKTEQTRTRQLTGPASQPWKCKPFKIGTRGTGYWYLHDTTFTAWKCENVEAVQTVFEATIETRPSSEIIWDVNNVYGLAKSRTNTGSIKYLGTFMTDSGLTDCEAACFKYTSGGAKCQSFVWHKHHKGKLDWRGQCFAVVGNRWSPVQDGAAVSGRVLREDTHMQDVSGSGCIGRCSGHGICQNSTGTCICDTGFMGFDCSIEVTYSLLQ